MPRYQPIRLFLVAVALAALVFAATAGVVWHNQANSSETNCSICHLNHQPIDHPLSCDRSPHFAPVGAQPELQDPALGQGPVVLRVPARAPPAV
jgi:hypothetical protein